MQMTPLKASLLFHWMTRFPTFYVQPHSQTQTGALKMHRCPHGKIHAKYLSMKLDPSPNILSFSPAVPSFERVKKKNAPVGVHARWKSKPPMSVQKVFSGSGIFWKILICSLLVQRPFSTIIRQWSSWSNSSSTKGMRHYNVRKNAVREAINEYKEVSVQHVGVKVNLADLFTKEHKSDEIFRNLRASFMSRRSSGGCWYDSTPCTRAHHSRVTFSPDIRSCEN
jgi:hypothetical protein